MYSIAVCDDDKDFAHMLLKTCGEIMSELGIPCRRNTYYSADDVLYACSRNVNIDLLILDIKLAEKNGIDLARELRERGINISIILISSDSSYLLDGYTVQPIYFLLKPFTREQLSKAISVDLRRRMRNKTITVKCEKKQVKIVSDSIYYLEVMDHTITIHTRSGEYATHSTLKQFLDMLPADQFCRCHNSYAVNLSFVSNISRTDGVALECSVKVPIGRKYYDELQQSFIKYVNCNI